uniref:Uncharacterized protein n=1 Tax=Vitis vinifera TaxID=29760 RepID=A5AQD4_VITVI|nr:hypothetical protein VITISV_005099 [Vitis vinifera]
MSTTHEKETSGRKEKSNLLRPRVPGDPRSCQMDGRAIPTNIDSWFSRSCKRRPNRSSGCDICECRVLLPEEVRIGEARHVYSWGNPDEINPDENVCHVSSGDVCHVWGGVPTQLN